MNQTLEARPIGFPDTDALRFLPEGPISISESKFSWVGIQHGSESTVGSVNIYDLLCSKNESFELPGRPGFAFPCKNGTTFVVGCERKLGMFDVRSGQWEPICEGVDSDVSGTIINDGLVFENNLIFGTKDLEFATKKAGLYLFRGSDQKLIRLRDDQICSNGKAIVQGDDGSLNLVDIDSPTRTIVRYPLDIAAGTLGEPTTVLDLTDDPAVPDGMIMTPDGKGIIVAMFHPGVAEFGQTRLYDFASGQLQCVWKTPGSPQNTCPALVRHDGEIKLIITTAVENLSAEDLKKCPNAGQIFIGDTDIQDPGGPLAPVYPSH
ncbi:SMP-30/Gluconolaconase/LRE-like region [Rubripirellula lacrimiformis]|uniref:SMP-30/Gluconolaconase/LRE-like region n=1 Tax=Rubripirellula lacrimiformis TaxID=1930273 RepID=A0A517NEP1_9BACT|nr:SMP-30/gluconolactonase/LRE family protein [Rubripirellula lacrimiformis]QDT05599.1 SMP-30/Gluconolaconase/LRE-like region [Rubripirellula lacrimiformis]